VAKLFGENKCTFYDEAEFTRLEQLYGKMTHLQTKGNQVTAG